MIPFIITNHGVTVFLDDGQQSIDETHPNFEDVIDAIRDEDVDEIRELINISRSIERWSQGLVTVIAGEVFYCGDVVNNVVTDRILDLMSIGFKPKSLAAFLTNVKNNPSYAAVEELYLFLEHNDIVLTEDGCFLAYKRVRDNYTDLHTGTFDNSVGATVKMMRNEVDDNRDRTCSRGLHFCASHYLPSFGGYSGNKIVVVKVNPADVVAIPNDYNNAKGRTWKYTVVAEVDSETSSLLQFATGNKLGEGTGGSFGDYNEG